MYTRCFSYLAVAGLIPPLAPDDIATDIFGGIPLGLSLGEPPSESGLSRAEAEDLLLREEGSSAPRWVATVLKWEEGVSELRTTLL